MLLIQHDIVNLVYCIVHVSVNFIVSFTTNVNVIMRVVVFYIVY